MIELKEKTLLLIVPKFYGYDKEILSEFKKIYKSVDIIYENRDWVSIWHRFVYVYLKSKKEKILDDFYLNEIKKLDRDIDTVLVIRGSSLSSRILEFMKNYFSSDCKYIMYQWDGIKNNKDALKIANYFDRVYTFDINDSKEYGWTYRPLFYCDKLVDSLKKDIDISFVCSLHSQRAIIMDKLKKICSDKSIKFYPHMYCNRFAYFKWKYIGKKEEYKNTNDKDVVFKSLSLKETYELYGKSKVVVDYTHPGQTGFTMRTIEALGNRCKLITNNTYIKDADFYDPNNIYVYSGTDINIPENFLETEYSELSSDMYNYYSIKGWINSLLEGRSNGES